MKALLTRISEAMMTLALLCAPAGAGEAGTSATAGYDRRTAGGVAEATANYDGRVGWARTDSEVGRRGSQAQGVAVGVDEDGLSLSVSNAVAPRNGPALATNFNLSIGRDGEVASSFGATIASGPIQREASVGGAAGSGWNGSVATSEAAGRTDRFGRVDTVTRAEQFGGRAVRRGAVTPQRALVNSTPRIAETPVPDGGVREVRRGLRAAGASPIRVVSGLRSGWSR